MEVYQQQEIFSLYLPRKCPKCYFATFYEKDINFSNCTNMGNKRDTVTLKLNNYF